MPRLTILPILPILCILAGGCVDRHDPLAGLSEDERALTAVIQRDSRVRIQRIQRLEDGSLTVSTRQGDRSVRYRITRDAQGVAGLAPVPEGRVPGLAIEPPVERTTHPERM